MTEEEYPDKYEKKLKKLKRNLVADGNYEFTDAVDLILFLKHIVEIPEKFLIPVKEITRLKRKVLANKNIFEENPFGIEIVNFLGIEIHLFPESQNFTQTGGEYSIHPETDVSYLIIPEKTRIVLQELYGDFDQRDKNLSVFGNVEAFGSFFARYNQSLINAYHYMKILTDDFSYLEKIPEQKNESLDWYVDPEKFVKFTGEA